MAVHNSKKAKIVLKIGLRGFLLLLIKILLSDLENSKWRMQYGG